MHKKPWGLLQWHLSLQNFRSADDIQLWVRIAAATAMGLGTSIGGYKIIKTVGGKIMKIRPVNGTAADLSSAINYFWRYTYPLTRQYNTRHFFCNHGCRFGPACERCQLGHRSKDCHDMGYYIANFSNNRRNCLSNFQFVFLISNISLALSK